MCKICQVQISLDLKLSVIFSRALVHFFLLGTSNSILQPNIQNYHQLLPFKLKLNFLSFTSGLENGLLTQRMWIQTIEQLLRSLRTL